MKKTNNIEKKILVIGSGPIIVGQACEFDYSGTQACKALIEEGYKVILLNPNPATIMTDTTVSNVTYFEELSYNVLLKIIIKEKPNFLLPTVGGQVALNLTCCLYENGILEKYSIQMLGISYEAIKKSEDRECFKKEMKKIGLMTAKSFQLNSISEINNNIKFPVILRGSYSLGGGGCGYARNSIELIESFNQIKNSTGTESVQVEESVIGWKEFELEAIRDKAGNCIIVCGIENIDPMGIHTGDSITVSPIQTLSDKEYQKMRQATFRILEAIGIEAGGANVQFAVNPKNGEMLVIEMNPRVSRSSALASKVTGYPIAKIATKLAIGYTIDQLENDLVENMVAAFEPTIDYVVCKIPIFDFKKFPLLNGNLGVRMQSVGEVMGIGRNFLESLNKAFESIENFSIEEENISTLEVPKILDLVKENHFTKIICILELIRRGYKNKQLKRLSSYDKWFIDQLFYSISIEKELQNSRTNEDCSIKLFYAKRIGFSDKKIAKLMNVTEEIIQEKRSSYKIMPVFKRIDSCSAEIKTNICYHYSTYDSEDELSVSKNKKALVIGSGGNRIGQGVEFDYCCVQCLLTLRENGYESIIINCNPETVSTDFDVSNKLFFEPLKLEYLSNIIDKEKPELVLYQFGGQTALNLALKLSRKYISNNSFESINLCENRWEFKNFLISLGLKTLYSVQLERNFTDAKIDLIQFPAIIRPSFIISGSKMKIVKNFAELNYYLSQINNLDSIYPILIEKFIENGIEIEIDAIYDGENVFVAGIMEQIESVGIHSGDSHSIYPYQKLSKQLAKELVDITKLIGSKLNLLGAFNVQFAIDNYAIYVIEVNPRASRSLPFLSKATGLPLVKIATECLLGKKINQDVLNYKLPSHYVSVKKPVFSKQLIFSDESQDSPEMKSTGEVMFFDSDYKSLLKKLNSSIESEIYSAQEVYSKKAI